MNLELRHDRDASCTRAVFDTSWNGVANGLGFVGIVGFGLGFQSKSVRTVSVREGASVVVGWEEEGSGRILYEACFSITIMLSRVAEDLKTSTPDSNSQQISEHANMSCIVDHLCLCLASSGSSLAYGSSQMLAAPCEACL
ncbi:hypothetical protein F2Q69_00029678 [Brassica cretica]|uniref:Uncharacterized protein n=1 Tax=Brassica cretica TaxID=69181 RepID=A0A8S9SBC0_BRACR|nr:hypothetical protein F2Q69_00029678 [Brassica cretica]